MLFRSDYATYRKALQVSAVHIYLTYPFVLSWSLLEALASGCLVIASDTAPVREVIRHGDNGWLVDFFDKHTLVKLLLHALAYPEQSIELRKQAKSDTKNYSIDKGNEGYLEIIRAL